MQESSISEKIKELRTDLKMNQKNFSAAIGIRQSTLSSYENGVVTPSNDVLLTIAQKFHVSLDWLFGLSENKVQISTLSDIIWVLLQMNESNELRYELDINNKLPGDIETETQKWYAGLRFYGNDPEHSLNADMCNFLADLQENRESLESYFTGKDMFDMWKKQTLEYYTSKPVTHKEIEELDFETRIRKRDELLTQKFSNNEQNAGFLIFLSGRKRYAFSHTQMLIHEGSAAFQGTAGQVEDAQKSYKKQIEEMKRYILDKTSIDEKTFNRNKNKDWYLSSEELVKYNIVDEIITDISVIL